jgi:hypothetical protein
MQLPKERLCLALAGWVVLLAGANSASAQSLEAVPTTPDFPPLAVATTVNPGQPVAAPCEVCWTADLLLGLPTGVRFQHTLGEDGGRNWLVEGFAGLEVIFPMAGVGLRRRFTPMSGQWDQFVISPGLDFYLLYNTFHNGGSWFGGGATFEMVSADVELVWQHRLSDRCAGNVGLKLGAGYVGNENGCPVIIPLADLFFGFRF